MSRSTASQKSFKTKLHHRRLSAVLKNTGHRPPGDRDRPILIRLAPEPGVEPSTLPPVRIFVGTEPAQFRAERVLVWSIRRHRDPARAYEIHLMSNLKGFDRSSWKTGFTQYRYAIPALAGNAGRAIYNDVDQIYLADPAILFDQDMGDAALLSIDDRETSVMLLDCAKLAPLWTLEMAKRSNKHKVFRAAVHDAGRWGHMDPHWNARDDEYAEGRSKLLHFTTLHTQPWQPFPELLRYRRHAQSALWDTLEAEADQAGFTLFTKAAPSERYRELLDLYATMHEEGRPESGHSAQSTFSGISLTEHVAPIAELVGRHAAATVLDYGSGKATLYQAAPGEDPASRYKTMPAWGDARVTCYDPAYPPFAGPYDSQYDGVITTDVLEHIPAEDIPWVLHHLFGHARKFVYAVAACYPAKKILPDGTNAHCTLCPPEWWAAQMELMARAHPGVDWVLCTQEKSPLAFEQRKKLLKSGIRSRFFSAKSASQAA
ncbi:MAG: hypothetical protein KF911_01465 [Pseudomonadales bacterium]|nr:hypothetical protein [Pseudomonadales bacterium]